MPELRKDPVTNRWVIIATERAKRPTDYKIHKEEFGGGKCPFCPGNEKLTPPEICAYREKDTVKNEPGWWVRVVPNLFPALAIEGNLDREGVGMFDHMNGVGAHEVIIETPSHEGHIELLSESQIEELLWMYKERYLDLQKDPRIKYILVFRNYGRTAGASLAHPHSQLIAMPIVPKRVEEMMQGTRAYYKQKERCIYCDIIHQEQKFGHERIVLENDSFIVLSPFAPRFPFELAVLPKVHEASFGKLSEKQRKDLASTMKDTLMRLSKILDRPPYNYMLQTAPCNTNGNHNGVSDYFHWHIEIIPRLTTPAGFEWGSGFFINPTPPEEAARYLRKVSVFEPKEVA